MKKNDVEFVSAESSAWRQASPSGSDSGNVRCHPHLALGSLFEGTRDPQYVAVSFRLDCVQDSPRCSTLAASFSSAQDPVIGHPKSKSTADANSTSLYLWSCY